MGIPYYVDRSASTCRSGLRGVEAEKTLGSKLALIVMTNQNLANVCVSCFFTDMSAGNSDIRPLFHLNGVNYPDQALE
ncbi:hypothetical protein EA58_16375 [Photobacterium galatheae]|uniref:Uncharacterized protein n=1 Tax=Photobacterium galatheae TaxID=1654360 RepID=A0A066RK57_9GAMM|nr:hypothetical protein EA58_16375 [Photobacterium galatheae]